MLLGQFLPFHNKLGRNSACFKISTITILLRLDYDSNAIVIKIGIFLNSIQITQTQLNVYYEMYICQLSSGNDSISIQVKQITRIRALSLYFSSASCTKYQNTRA